MNALNLWTDRKGAIAVEFALIAGLLLFLVLFITDLVIRQATVGKLDRVSYSVSGVLRERMQLYDGREALKQSDVNDVLRLAKRMLTDMHADADLSQLGVRVEELHFKDTISLGDTSKVVSAYRSWKGGAGDCRAPQELTQLTNLAPKGSYGRWVPLYQVSVCLPTVSWFSRLSAGLSEKPTLSSFAIVMAR